MKILGIESSCDETAAAVVADGNRILSSVVASQIKTHARFGGVVPELASREHMRAIVAVVEKALAEADISLEKIDLIAATQGPGLIGALLIGFSYAKAMAYALEIPCVGVNHLDGHIHSLFLGDEKPSFPFVALLVSGGHTNLYHVTAPTQAELLGQTLDDAVGEAFDKVSKMMGLGYPGGPIIGKLAAKGDPERIHFPRAWLKDRPEDFSFSGLKTAVRTYLQKNGDRVQTLQADIAASFQEAAVDVLCQKTVAAAQRLHCRRVALVGGVAANQRLRQLLQKQAAAHDLDVFIPDLSLCGDNAAMIAAAGFHLRDGAQKTGLDADVYCRHRF